MSSRDRSIWAGGIAAAMAACAVLPLAASPARSETLESALMQAYQNNPSLNSQRAAMRAIDEGVPQALSGYRPRVAVTAIGGEQTSSIDAKVHDHYARHVAIQYAERLQLARPSRRHHHPDDFQRLSDRQQDPPGRERRCWRARDVAHHRTDRAAQRGDRLHESVARHRDPRSAAAQRRGAAGATAPDSRPLQCRRGDAHRRGAGRIEPRRRSLAGADRGSQFHRVGCDLPAGHRHQSGQAFGRHAGRPVLAA